MFSWGFFLLPLSSDIHIHTLIRHTHTSALTSTHTHTQEHVCMLKCLTAHQQAALKPVKSVFFFLSPCVCSDSLALHRLRDWSKMFSFFYYISFLRISLKNHYVELYNETRKKQKQNLFCQKTERKLHLENPWEIWAGDLNCLLWEQSCFVTRRCVGRDVWEVQKWLSCYCFCWKHSIVTDSKYQGGYSFPF